MFLKALTAEGIPASGGYAHPLYRNPMFRDPALPVDYSRYADLCPASERACDEAVWLEHRLLLGDGEDMDDIARAVHRVYEHRGELG
jgi:perosamine synthetase